MPKVHDFTGQRFGRLTAIRFTGIDRHKKRVWLWQCDCGKQKEICHTLVRLGKTTSCGCLASELLSQRNSLDITGERFSRLVALRQTGDKRGANHIWEFRCDCGRLTRTTVHSVRSGNTNSCGCYLKDRIAETQRIDLTGQRYGCLEALRYSHSSQKKNGTRGQAYWWWKCDCGNEFTAPGVGVRQRFERNGEVSCASCGKKRGAATRAHDHTGQRFGMLVGIKRLAVEAGQLNAKWEWQCDCGNTCIRFPGYVKRHRNPNCGCSKKNTSADRTGERFGLLVALEQIGLDKSGRTYVWRFQCDCGNTCEARLRDAVSGLQQSCGCRQGGYDSVRAWIDGQFRNADQQAVFYVFPLARFSAYAKPGISTDLSSRVRSARGEYGAVHDFIELPRLDAWLLEQAVLKQTANHADCPSVLAQSKWEGFSEVRRMTCDELFDIALKLHDEMQDLGRPVFASRYLTLTPRERRSLAMMEA